MSNVSSQDEPAVLFPPRLSMPIGEAMFTQRAIRRFTDEPVSTADLEIMLAAASKAPNGGNSQRGRFLVVRDRKLIEQFGVLYRRAWWAKRFEQRGWRGPEDVPADELPKFGPPMRLAEEMKGVPCVAFVLSTQPSFAESVLPAAQNFMLAGRALGIGSVPTRLHPDVLGEVREMFKIPEDVVLHLTIVLGHPAGRFGPTVRKPISETTFWEVWGSRTPSLG